MSQKLDRADAKEPAMNIALRTSPYGTDLTLSTGGHGRVWIGVGADESAKSIGQRVIAAMLGEIGTEAREQPIPMLLTCPTCGARHIDRGTFATKSHTTHACQACGMCWRPAVVATVGVQFLPGFKDEAST